MITFTYASYNSYIIISNSLLLLGIYFVNHYAEAWNLRLLQHLLSLRPIRFFEWFISALGFLNIWYATRGVKNPFLSPLMASVQQYCFTQGPLLTGLSKLIRDIRAAFEADNTPTVKKHVEQELVDNSTKAVEDRLINLFSKKDMPSQLKQDSFKDLPSATTTSFAIREPINSLFAAITETPKTSTFNNDLFFNLPLEPSLSEMPETTEEEQKRELKLEYTPCIRPPLKPSQHRERLLWFLSPTPEVVEDFRIEQMIQMEQNWHKFNDRNSRTLYDKMTNILLTKMLKPLAESIEEHEKILASTGRNLANCPSSVAMLSMIMSANTTIAFNMPEIESFINVDGSSRVEMRQYVIDRIKELASSPRMAAYRYVSQVKDMPTDAEIIMHIFNQYLSLKEPYAIPPLVPVEGDLFKFLLIYVKITPELDHWRL